MLKKIKKVLGMSQKSLKDKLVGKTRVNLFSKNHSVSPLRYNSKEEDLDKRHPLGTYGIPVLVNFGSRTESCRTKTKEVLAKGGVVLNHYKNVATASNKIKCKEVLIKHGINTPKFIVLADLIKEVDSKGIPVISTKDIDLQFPIVAKKISGMGGKGMKKLDTLGDFNAWRKNKKADVLREYFLEEVFQPNMANNYEFRIGVSPLLASLNRQNCYLGEIVILRKLMKKEAVENGEFGRNLSLGNSYFTRVEKATKEFKKNEKINRKSKIVMNIKDGIELARQATLACELDFSAADVMFDSVTGEWTIIELNTAPSMGNPDEGHSYTLDAWKNATKEMIVEKIKLQ